MNSRGAIVSVTVGLVGLYALAFHGDNHTATSTGPYSVQHVHYRQYFFGKVLWEEDTFSPPLTNRPAPTLWICGYEQRWRGFGFPFKGRKRWLDTAVSTPAVTTTKAESAAAPSASHDGGTPGH